MEAKTEFGALHLKVVMCRFHIVDCRLRRLCRLSTFSFGNQKEVRYIDMSLNL